MIRQGRKKVPAGLCLFPKGDKYGHSDSIIRSSRIVWGAYAIRPYKRGFAPRPLPPHLSPIGAICGAYAIHPYIGGFAPRPLPPRLSPTGAICGAYAIRPYIGGCAPRPFSPRLSPIGAICGAYAIRPYKQGWRFVLFSPFLSLMKEKEAKENQGVRDASQICRVPAGDVRDTDPIRHIRPIFPGLGRGLDLLLPSFLLSREEKKVPFIRGIRQRERFCLFLSPFPSLMRLNI